MSLVGTIIFSVYLNTLSPSIAGGDSGEIVAEGCQLGIAHPPGYPIITLLIHAISRLDIALLGSVATRVNSFCALCTSLACCCLGLTVSFLSPSSGGVGVALPGVVLSMLTFAFSPLIWQYAITAEVFPLNTFFASLLLFLTVWFSRTPSTSTACLGAFCCGLALCNQHTIILYEAPLVLWMLVLMRRRLLKDAWLLAKLSVAFLVGFSPYLYLPLSGLLNPRQGSWGDVTTLSGFLHHFLRRDYGTFRLFSGAAGANAEGLWERNQAYVRDLLNEQASPAYGVLIALGLIVSLSMPSSSTSQVSVGNVQHLQPSPTPPSKPSATKKQKKSKPAENMVVHTSLVEPCDTLALSAEAAWTPFVLLISQLCYFFIFHSLSNLPLKDKLLYGVHQRFWMQPNVLTFIWLGVGFNAVVHTTLAVVKKVVKREEGRVGGLIVMATTILAIVLGFNQYSRNFFANDQRDNMFFNQYASAVLSPLPSNSILLINYDQQWTSVRYMQLCENYRTDITAIQLSMMTYQWFQTKTRLYRNITFPGSYLSHANSQRLVTDKAFTLLQFLQANKNKSIYLGGKLIHPDPALSQQYDLQPVGLVSLFTPLDKEPHASFYRKQAIKSWREVLNALPMLPNVTKYPEETWEWTIGRDYKDRLQGKIQCCVVDRPRTGLTHFFCLKTREHIC